MSFQRLFDFERAMADYTGAPYVVATDGCTHAIELALRYHKVQSVEFTAYTYISIPQTMINLGIEFSLTDEEWQGEYQLHGSRIWDSARRLEPNMYRSGQVQCLSFGNGKPLQIGRLGAILLDDEQAYHRLSQMRSDGRDLAVTPWIDQRAFSPGWHYCPTLEDCDRAMRQLPSVQPQSQKVAYPDCRKISIII